MSKRKPSQDWRRTRVGSALHTAGMGGNVPDSELDAIPVPPHVDARTFRRDVRTFVRLAQELSEVGLHDEAERHAEQCAADLLAAWPDGIEPADTSDPRVEAAGTDPAKLAALVPRGSDPFGSDAELGVELPKRDPWS
jgi:hypothetical protein